MHGHYFDDLWCIAQVQLGCVQVHSAPCASLCTQSEAQGAKRLDLLLQLIIGVFWL